MKILLFYKRKQNNKSMQKIILRSKRKNEKNDKCITLKRLMKI